MTSFVPWISIVSLWWAVGFEIPLEKKIFAFLPEDCSGKSKWPLYSWAAVQSGQAKQARGERWVGSFPLVVVVPWVARAIIWHHLFLRVAERAIAPGGVIILVFYSSKERFKSMKWTLQRWVVSKLKNLNFYDAPWNLQKEINQAERRMPSGQN